MDSIYFRDPNGQLLELACYKFVPPEGYTVVDVLATAHRIRVAEGAYNIANFAFSRRNRRIDQPQGSIAPSVEGARWMSGAAFDTDPSPVGTFWMRDLARDRTPDGAPALSRAVATFRRAGLEEATSLAAAMGRDDPTPVLERFAGGRRCYIGVVEDALATYGWVSLEGEMDRRTRLAPPPPAWRCLHLGLRQSPCLPGAGSLPRATDLYRPGVACRGATPSMDWRGHRERSFAKRYRARRVPACCRRLSHSRFC